MLCKKCPHYVRHGQIGTDRRTISFKNRCGLKMRNKEDVDCINFPFPKVFDYSHCPFYINTFKSASQRNDVVPTQDFQYSDALNTVAITDMELL